MASGPTRPVVYLTLALGALAPAVAAPFTLNQNTYLLHAVGPSKPGLRDDWLLTTTDPLPVFTALARLIFRLGGTAGLNLVSYLAVLAATAGLYLIARALLDPVGPGEREWPALVAALAVPAASNLFALSRIPVVESISPFNGIGGQYFFSRPGYLQPSVAGSLLLLALGLSAWEARCSAPRSTILLVSAGLVVTGCVVHPTYLVPLGVGITSIMVADLVTKQGLRRLRRGAVTVGTAGVLVLITNPIILSSIGHSGPASDFFAFERIPHHTLMTHWQREEVMLVAVVAAAALVARPLTGSWWLTTALTGGLVLSVTAALVVLTSRNSSLAMMFPWRISVLLVPMSFLVIIVWLLNRLRERVPSWTWPALAFGLVALCLVGGLDLVRRSPHPADGAQVVAVGATAPAGVGLVPLTAQTVRLNAGAAVFVDWKSHPYTEEELAEWSRRVHAVREAQYSMAAYCALVEDEGIDWVLIETSADPPSCVSDWPQTRIGEWSVLQRRIG